MSITGKVDAMMGGLRRENNALRKNYERERTRTTVLESRILHAFLAAVHAELPCPFCGAETNYVSPFARHIGDCIVETIELAVASPPSVSEPKYTAEKPLTLSYRELRPSEAVTPKGDCPLCEGTGIVPESAYTGKAPPEDDDWNTATRQNFESRQRPEMAVGAPSQNEGGDT